MAQKKFWWPMASMSMPWRDGSVLWRGRFPRRHFPRPLRGEIGTPRLLKLFDKYHLKTTWFIPGHSLETFPEQMRMVVEAGHEIGAHGYAHENPIAMTPQQEEEVLRTCVGLIERVTGRRPAGYVAPWWEFSNVTNELLLQHGFKYDHSLMHNDFHPYYVRVGDHWTKIDYARSALTWMQPLVRGHETGLIEIPANWYLDDLPPMMFIKNLPTAMALSIHARLNNCGAINLTGCIGNTTTPCSP